MALGSDIAGVTSPDWSLSTVTGQRALAEAVLRRLSHEPGSNITEPNYGYRLRDLIGGNTPASIVQQKVLAQCYAEEEVIEASVGVALGGGIVQTAIQLVDQDGNQIALTVTAGALTVTALMNGSPFWEST